MKIIIIVAMVALVLMAGCEEKKKKIDEPNEPVVINFSPEPVTDFNKPLTCCYRGECVDIYLKDGDLCVEGDVKIIIKAIWDYFGMPYFEGDVILTGYPKPNEPTKKARQEISQRASEERMKN